MNDKLLRTALKVDGVVCATVGLICAVGVSALDGALGIPAGWLFGIGLLLVACGAVLWWMSVSAAPAAYGRVAVAVNLAWAAASVVAIVAGWWPLTGLGVAVVIAQAVAVVALADLEYMGLRRVGRPVLAQ
jgi:hypothetical protein